MERICEKEKYVQKLIDSGLSFALYRLPQTTDIRLVLQLKREVYHLSSDDTEPKGFIFAPFAETPSSPMLLIEPQIVATGWQEIEDVSDNLPQHRIYLSRQIIQHIEDNYPNAFQHSSEQIRNGIFEKIVLADKFIAKGSEHLLGKEAKIFCQAVEDFPNSMVSLVYTPISGRWMSITPEILLVRDRYSFHTMALAGTKTDENEEWDKKNQTEHETVVQYLADTFEYLKIPFHKNGPYTRKAGNLFHLCTDFRIPNIYQYTTMELLRWLHPTPAVCGIPKDVTFNFIRRHEKACRSYYSGYLGPINLARETHIFVNLRCAMIRKHSTIYYAGGGVNAMSEYEKERLEIERKMNILKQFAHV